MKKIILDKTEVTQDSLPYVIAEIGHNHQGSVEKCKELKHSCTKTDRN